MAKYIGVATDAPPSIMIVTEYNGQTQGFLGGEVDTILRIDWSEMKVPPAMLTAQLGGLVSDAPALDCAYKLQEYAGRPCRKRSEGKATWPGRKQVYRSYADRGGFDYDVLSPLNERGQGEPLLHPVMKEGRRLAPSPNLTELRGHMAAQLARIPESLRTIETAPTYEVRISPALQALAKAVDHGL